jgi:protein TonB
MITIENNAATLNEIIFKNRNKSYGAYVIRSEYGSTILKSLGAAVLFLALVSLLAVWLTNTVEEVKKLDIGENIVPICDLYKVEVDVTPVQKKVVNVVIPPTASAANTQAVSTNLNDHAIEQKTNPVQTIEGTNNADGKTANPDAATGSGTNDSPTGTGDISDVAGANSPPVLAPDVMPSFDNMAAFLQKNLKYPAMALDGNVSGKVIVNFIIDEEGNIVSAILLKGIGYGCDEEALRVIKLMPKWKPGMFAGKAVKVSFKLPIVFRLQ